jgi:hypothetical protein
MTLAAAKAKGLLTAVQNGMDRVRHYHQVAVRSSVSHIETGNIKIVFTGEKVKFVCLFVYSSFTDAVRSV